MSAEREQMKVKLTNLRYREKELTDKVGGLCGVIRHNLSAILTPIADMNIPETAGQMDDLVMAWGELQATLADIARLEKELS
ncbi:MAG: hypothetical protein JXL84_15095 [Deltaproteobacteria bacterium]|nr:hypothetical protein [Deltaproteobacteria bacterium]